MKFSTKLFISSVSLVLLLAVINGCKKNSDISSKEQQAAARDAILDKLKEKFKNEPQTSIMKVNLPGRGYYGDLDGNIINRATLQQNRTEYDCPDPSDDYFSQSVTSITSEFTCNQGFRVEVTYEVSVLYNLVGANPNNSSQLSKGKLRLKNSGGTVIWSNTSITPVSITNLGVDPSDASLTRFQVVFKSPYIDETTFNNSATAEPSLFCYTDCSSVPSINIGYSSQQAVSTTAYYSQPCSRVDKVYYNPASGGTPNTVTGCDAVPNSCFPYGYVLPDRHEIQWYDPVTSSWKALNLSWYGNYPSPQGEIYTFDLYFIDLSLNTNMSTGNTYQVRYRNKQISGNGSPCTSDIWVTENWYVN